MRDLLVAGGGPAGLATAICAAQAGMAVTVVEPRAGDIDKACGEGLMPPALAALAPLGVHPPGLPFRGIRYLDGPHTAEALFSAGPGRGVRRTALHAALRSRADALGVETVRARVGDLSQDDDGVDAAGLRARWMVAADGLHSPVRRTLGLDAPPSAQPRYGLRRHHQLAPWTDLVEVHWSADAEAYVTPVAADSVGVAVLFRRSGAPGDFAGMLNRFPVLAERLAGAPCGPVVGAGPFRQSARRRVHGRVLLVGDAAGYVDALTGEGVSLALRSAAAAVACLRDGAPQRYEQEWQALSRRYRTLTSALLAVRSRPVLRRRLVRSAARAPRLFASAVDLLG